MNVFSYEKADGWHHPPLASKMRGIKLTQGKAVRLETPAGGGYGKAVDRDPKAVARDVAVRRVSAGEACGGYGHA